MTLEENKAIARIWFDVMNHHDLDLIDRAYAEDYVHHGPNGMEIRGADRARQIAAMLIEAVPDRIATVVSQVAEGDVVATRWRAVGTNTGPLFGDPPTNGPFEAEGLVMSRIVDGRIVEDYEINHIST